ncbi:MAG: hypothetical protein ACOYLS_11785 [Polymorphobacter sp.]
MTGWLAVLAVPAIMAAAPAPDAAITGRTIVERAFAAAGGRGWAEAKTLALTGRAVFYGAGSAPRSTVDDYRMWREFEDVRTSAHGEAGKVRIEARHQGKPVFLVGSDGTTSFNEKGVIPKAEADAFWASNFGFGVIRSALGSGFRLDRLPDDNVAGHDCWMVRVTDPAGTATLFGVDKASAAIRLAGFATPRGWHVRIYDDFVRLKQPDWLQARKVTLYYNGVKANEVFWTSYTVNVPIAPELFKPPA